MARGDDACPCGGTPTGTPFERCCGRWLADVAGAPAPDAEAVMRSRYSAFVRQDADYLRSTWHVSTRPHTLDFEPGTQWLGLQVRAHRVIDTTHAEVEFVARSRLHGRATRLHERSRFVREADADGALRWFYVDGDVDPANPVKV
ncbi:YchJ family metal-binding protein [Ottowia sp. SB7-C50]|nr:YchJ family metal-binding protein [Ottowia sp. SB7-C50]WOP17154.1 YchJ family metal-binding protein [Ottowia sp. SB7-C50]